VKQIGEENVIEVHDNKVACEPLYDPDTTESGRIIIPEAAKERCDQGIVKYIGKNVTLVKPGDHVLFSGYTGTFMQIQYEGKLIVLPERFIIAIVHDDPLDIQGLFFRGRDGAYFTATYEQAITLMARALESHNRVGPSKNRNKIAARPKVEEYDESTSD
jgi:co-chaperonin GroES (HSP10)